MKKLFKRFLIWRAKRLERKLGRAWKDLGVEIWISNEPPEELYAESEVEYDPAFLFVEELKFSEREAPLTWKEGEIRSMDEVIGAVPLSKEQREKVAEGSFEFYGPVENRRDLWPEMDSEGTYVFPLSAVE